MVQADTSGTVPHRWVPETREGELVAAFFRLMRQFKAMRGADPAMACLGTLMRTGPARITTLAEELRLDISTTSRHVRQLEQSGLLARERDPADQRATLLTISPAGAAHVRQGMQHRAQAMQAATTAWPESDLTTLTDLLNRLAEDLGEVIAASGEST
jgi:DNA-binding MarR family transcriptional regulator